MEIIWTDEAQEELLALTRYYWDCAGERVADKMFRTITDTVSRLSSFPLIGQRVAGYGDLYRSIVAHPYYKVIYRVEDENVIIISVWDCRQNPETLENELHSEE